MRQNPGMATPPGISIEPPERVERPVLLQRWSDLAFLHWPVEPVAVARLLPPGLAPDTFEGRAWVGLIGFRMLIHFPWHPPVPLLSHFPEVNVRTYVRGPRGDGIWFFSLDISRLLPVLCARWFWGVPYMWGRMRMARTGQRLRFSAERQWPKPKATSVFEIEPSPAEARLGELDHFVTARWSLYLTRRSQLSRISVEHPPWPLRRATVIRVEDSLIETAGLPTPKGDPVAHWSPGVSVRFGHIERV